MLPVIALVGRPNVGKSTLFNRLTRSRDALVANVPGLTRDRKYGDGKIGEHPFIVIDTGGLTGDTDDLEGLMAQQSWQAVEEADLVFFMVDGRDGLAAGDEVIAAALRRTGKSQLLVVNKTDGVDADTVMADFFSLGLGEPHPIAAVHGRGVNALMDIAVAQLPPAVEDAAVIEDDDRIRVAVVGRPNVGKSTLINRIMGEERVLAFDMPGTTRDSIFIPFERDETAYTLIDTAGVRRRARVSETVEKFSVIKTLQAIDAAHVVILLLDAQLEISEQDASLAGYIAEKGRALILAVNKWDGVEPDQRDWIKSELGRRLQFADYADSHYISALHGTAVGHLYKSIDAAYQSATRKLATNALNLILEGAVFDHPPPMVNGRRIKMRYAHAGGQNPPLIVIHGNQTGNVPNSYQRYLEKVFRRELKLVGTPVRIEFRTGDNPFAEKRNKLTQRQVQRKRRMMSHVKKNKKKSKKK